jgi:hypothetical protein
LNWDKYDPRLSSSTTGTAGDGGSSGGSAGSGGSSGGTSSGGAGGAGASGGSTTSMGGTGAAGMAGSGGTGTGGTGGMAGAGGGGAGSGGAPPCSGTSLLADNFDDGKPGVPWDWVSTPAGAAVISESNMEAVVSAPAGSPGPVYGALQTKRYYDLQGDTVSVKVTKAADPATASTFFLVRYDDANYLEISQKNGTLSLVAVKDNGAPDIVGQMPYDPSKHRTWRFRESGGNTYWETLDDGNNVSISDARMTSKLFDLSSVRVDMGVRLDGGEPSPSEARFAAVNGGGTPSGKWCAASSLTEEFDSAGPGHAWARSYAAQPGGCSLVGQGGELVLTSPSGQTSYCAYESSSSYDLTGSSLAVAVPQIVNPATAGEIFLRADVEGEGSIEVTQTSGQLRLRTHIGNTLSTPWSAAYTPDMVWWRLSEKGGKTYFDYSSDGKAWTPGTSIDNPVSLTAVDVLVGGGAYVASPMTVTAHFDHLNKLP